MKELELTCDTTITLKGVRRHGVFVFGIKRTVPDQNLLARFYDGSETDPPAEMEPAQEVEFQLYAQQLDELLEWVAEETNEEA